MDFSEPECISTCKGGILVEFALSLFFFIPVIFGLVDMSVMLINFQKIEQAVREGARTASKLPPPLVSAHTFVDHDLLYQQCQVPIIPQPTTALDCGHVLIHARIRAAMNLQNMVGVKVFDYVGGSPVPAANIHSRFTEPTAAAAATDDTIEVWVDADYDGFFGTWPLRASYRGPWLYQNAQAAGTGTGTGTGTGSGTGTGTGGP
jgi:hypothetical protein